MRLELLALIGFPVNRYKMLTPGTVASTNAQLRDLAGNAFQGFSVLAMMVAVFSGMPPSFLTPFGEAPGPVAVNVVPMELAFGKPGSVWDLTSMDLTQ